MFAIFFYEQAEAAPNVAECVKDEVDCEEPTDSVNETEENNNDLLVNTESTGSLAFEIVKMVFALVLVIALIYILIKFLSKRNKLSNSVKALDNLGGISVGQNKSIQIIRIGSKLYLVGVGNNVELLQEITDEEVKKDILLSKERATDDFPGGALITTLFPIKKDAKPETTEINFKKLFSKELENLKQNRNKMINQHKEDTHE